MATALSNETPLPREHSISPYCEGSPTCQRCGGWQCDDRTRRHSDITRPSTTIGWSRPHQSCPVAPRIRPATAVGWESKDERNWKEFDMSCKEKLDEMDKLDEMESTALESSTKLLQSSESKPMCSDQGVKKLLDILQSKKKEKYKFKLLISALIQGSKSVNDVGEDEMTPLHYAVWNGEELCVKALVVFDANINARNVFLQTPLDIATHNQREHLVPLLLSIGCVSGKELSSATLAQTPTSSSPPFCSTAKRGLVAGCNANSCSTPSLRSKKSVHEFGSHECLCKGERERCGSDLSQRMEQHMEKRLEMTLSLNTDEALALALQKQEIARFRSKDCCQPTTPPATRPLISRTRLNGGRPQRILSLDGGGVRGLIQIDVLLEIERQTGQNITKLFDWIVGTSTGAIVAMMLVYKQSSLNYIRDLYFRLKEEVFSKGRVGFCYDTNKLEELLKEEFGTDMRMSDVQHPKILVCAVDKSTIPLKLHFFNNCFHDEFSHQLIWKVARYTSAAPMYFTECDNYVDGGVLANNPCNHALSKIQSFYHSKDEHFPVACMVSIGSGLYPQQKLGSVDFHVFLRLKFSGMFQKAQSLIRMLSSAIGESEALADRCRESCRLLDIEFFRFNPNLPEKIDPGVTNNLKLMEMMIATRIYIRAQSLQLQQLLPLLHQH